VGGPHCCGLIPHLELAHHPDLAGSPVVVGEWSETAQGGARVLTCSSEAAEHGVRAGMTMRNAEQLCPSATLVEPRPEESGRLRERLSSALYDLAPAVEVRESGAAWVNLEGLPAVLKGEAVREMRRRLRQVSHVEPRLGLAPGPFAAMVAARQAAPGRVVRVEDARRFLAPLPIAELQLEPELHDRLDLLGLRTLGQVAEVGPRRLESQLGPPGRRAVLLARGEEPEPIRPWRAPRFLAAYRRLEPPVEDREALLFITRALCGDIAAELGLRGAGAKRVRVKLGIEDLAEPERRESLVRHALSSTTELFGLVSSWLREWQPAAVTEVAVEVPELEPAGRRQLRLWVGGDAATDEVEAALERLQERHGELVAVRMRRALVASGIPSQRYEAVPV
jgi:nucleotidyltransferase/DNA polymerase involved in DNA repair